jgi:hypothetical protein
VPSASAATATWRTVPQEQRQPARRPVASRPRTSQLPNCCPIVTVMTLARPLKLAPVKFWLNNGKGQQCCRAPKQVALGASSGCFGGKKARTCRAEVCSCVPTTGAGPERRHDSPRSAAAANRQREAPNGFQLGARYRPRCPSEGKDTKDGHVAASARFVAGLWPRQDTFKVPEPRPAPPRARNAVGVLLAAMGVLRSKLVSSGHSVTLSLLSSRRGKIFAIDAVSLSKSDRVTLGFRGYCHS